MAYLWDFEGILPDEKAIDDVCAIACDCVEFVIAIIAVGNIGGGEQQRDRRRA